MVDRKGRVAYTTFMDYLRECDESQFIEEAEHPLLLGKELYDGVLQKAAGGEGLNTMEFSVSALRAESNRKVPIHQHDAPVRSRHESDFLARAIYILRKQPNSPGRSYEFSIGRDAENDLVIPDYSISKFHAFIVAVADTYYLFDRGSTNETCIDDVPVPANKMTALRPNVDVAFGRMVFRFAPAEHVYDLLNLQNSPHFKR